MPLAPKTLARPVDWDGLDALKYEDETAAVRRLLREEPLGRDAEVVRLQAVQLVIEARRLARRQGVVESFLQEFGLSTPRGPGADVPGRGAAAHARRGDARPR